MIQRHPFFFGCLALRGPGLEPEGGFFFLSFLFFFFCVTFLGYTYCTCRYKGFNGMNRKGGVMKGSDGINSKLLYHIICRQREYSEKLSYDNSE